MIKAIKSAGLVIIIALGIVVALIIIGIVAANVAGPPRRIEDDGVNSSISSNSPSEPGAGSGADSGAGSDAGSGGDSGVEISKSPGSSSGDGVGDAARPDSSDSGNSGASSTDSADPDNGGSGVLDPAATPDPDFPDPETTGSPLTPSASPATSPSPSPPPASSPQPSPLPAPDSDTTSPTGILAADPGIQAALDAIAAKFGAVGIQVAVINNGVIAGTYEYGYATKGTAPMTVATKIRSASLSKVALAMMMMQLIEQDKINIDADIGEYWGMQIRNPNHRDTPITMRHILSHTSSIIIYDYGFSAPGDLIKTRLRDGTCFDRKTPGQISSWGYNNYAFAVLGLTVEHAAGETVNTLAARNLFAPLGIDSAFGSGSISDTDRLATLYTYGGGVGRSTSVQRDSRGSTFPGERGDEFPGGLTISAYDFAKLIAVLVNKGEYGGVRVMSRDSVALMESPQGRVDGFDQCLAIRRINNLFGEDELFYHTGSNYGVFSLFSYNRENRSGVVVFTSGADGRRDAVGVPVVCGEISEYVYKLIRT